MSKWDFDDPLGLGRFLLAELTDEEVLGTCKANVGAVGYKLGKVVVTTRRVFGWRDGFFSGVATNEVPLAKVTTVEHRKPKGLSEGSCDRVLMLTGPAVAVEYRCLSDWGDAAQAISDWLEKRYSGQ